MSSNKTRITFTDYNTDAFNESRIVLAHRLCARSGNTRLSGCILSPISAGPATRRRAGPFLAGGGGRNTSPHIQTSSTWCLPAFDAHIRSCVGACTSDDRGRTGLLWLVLPRRPAGSDSLFWRVPPVTRLSPPPVLTISSPPRPTALTKTHCDGICPSDDILWPAGDKELNLGQDFQKITRGMRSLISGAALATHFSPSRSFTRLANSNCCLKRKTPHISLKK